jgi:hypothetical protein
MERVYIQWNLVNWITIVLMAAVGMMAVGAVAKAIRSYSAPAAE